MQADLGKWQQWYQWASGEIVTARGTFKRHVEHTPGSLQWPMTDADRRDKFLGCAVPVLGEARAEGLLAQLRDCALAGDVGAVARATVPLS